MSVLDGKHAVVTGGASGIGLAIAQMLGGHGARVSVVSRSAHARDGASGFFRASADVANKSAVTKALSACRAAHGPVAILVNNAGIAESAAFRKTDDDLWRRAVETNLNGTYYCTYDALPDMLGAGWGRIVNIASIAGLYGAPYTAAYTASKHGIVGLTRALAAEYSGTGVTVSVVCPGYTEGALVERAVDNIARRAGLSKGAARDRLAKTNPGGRFVTADEIAQAVLDLCGGDANGAEIILPRS